MRVARAALIWAALALAVGWPLADAASSELLQYRDVIYATSGFAGLLALALLLFQPLLAGGWLPGLPGARGRRAHRWIGGALVGLVVIHVAGLWITSPPDMVDALLFRSPTPFSPFGVVAMWALCAVVVLAAVRLRLRLRTWRIAHMCLAVVIIVGSVAHVVLVEGTIEPASKAALCVLIVLAAATVMADLRRRMKKAPSSGRGLARR